MVLQLENANVNQVTIKAMEQGSKLLKSIHKKIDTSAIDVVIDDLKEQMDTTQEISETLAQKMDSNEDDLLDELQELESEMETEDQQKLDKALSSIDKSNLKQFDLSKLPQVPTKLPLIKAVTPIKADDDEEMRKLEAQFS